MPNNKPRIESPCVRECSLDRDRGVCVSCFRNLQEIVDWRKMSPEERLEVMDDLPGRRSAWETGPESSCEAPEPEW